MHQIHYIQVKKDLKLFVETYGVKGHEACLLISGAGAITSFWSERLCHSLSDKGFFVIQYDHRDVGYSDKINFNEDPYDMMDLTRDAFSLLNELEVEKAHIIGHSMGGFIAQLMAIHFPERLQSLISASSSTNSPEVPSPPDKTWKMFMENKPRNDFEQDLEGFLKVWKYLNGTAEFDEELAIAYTRQLYDRQEIKGPLGESHVKSQEHLSDRSELLKQIKIPALIIHGEEDYLVDPYGGVQTAECIKNSKLVLIPQMGHIPFNKYILKQFEDEIIKFLLSRSQE